MHQPAHRFGAFDRGRIGGFCGNDEEVLALIRFLEASVAFFQHWQAGRAEETEVGFCVGVLEVVFDFVPFQQHAQGHHHPTRLQNAEVSHREVRHVQAAKGHLIARLNTGSFQAVGHLIGGTVDLGVGQVGIHEDESIAVGVAAGAVF